MAAIDEAFWLDLDAHIVARRSKDPAATASAVIELSPSANTSPFSHAVSASPRQVASDWTGVLDTINAAKCTADRQELRLKAQAAAHEDLDRELKLAQNRIQALEALVSEMRAQAEAKEQDVRARAEALRQETQAKTDAQIRAAEDRVRASELRATVAEDWLKRIEQASRDLLPSDRRAAA